MKCKVCGSAIGPEDKVCKGCGIPVDQLKKDGNVEYTTTPPPAAGPAPAAAPLPGAAPTPAPTPVAPVAPVTPVAEAPRPASTTPASAPLPGIKPPTPTPPAPTAEPMDNSFVDEPKKVKKGTSPVLVVIATLLFAGIAVYLLYTFLPNEILCKNPKQCEVCEECPPPTPDPDPTPTPGDEVSVECTIDSNENNIRLVGTYTATIVDDAMTKLVTSVKKAYVNPTDANAGLTEAEGEYATLSTKTGITGNVGKSGMTVTSDINYDLKTMVETDVQEIFGATKVTEAGFKTYATTKGYTCN